MELFRCKQRLRLQSNETITTPNGETTLFQQVYLTSRTIEWPNGADFAPEFLLELVKLSSNSVSAEPARIAA